MIFRIFIGICKLISKIDLADVAFGTFIIVLLGGFGGLVYKMLAGNSDIISCYTEIDERDSNRLLIMGRTHKLIDIKVGFASTNGEAIRFIYTNPSCPESKKDQLK